jgi:hypothetical protein
MMSPNAKELSAMSTRRESVEERAQKVRDDVSARRAHRLGRGNCVHVSAGEAEQKRKEQPERHVTLAAG